MEEAEGEAAAAKVSSAEKAGAEKAEAGAEKAEAGAEKAERREAEAGEAGEARATAAGDARRGAAAGPGGACAGCAHALVEHMATAAEQAEI